MEAQSGEQAAGGADAAAGGTTIIRALQCISEHLTSARDLSAIARTCREWHSASLEPGFWSRLDLRGLASAESALALLSTPKFSQATVIAIQFCDTLLDSHLALFPPTLRELVLDACHRVTDAGVEIVAERCRELRKLSLYWNNNVSDAGVLKVALFCRRLVDLSFSGCHRITSTGVRRAGARPPSRASPPGYSRGPPLCVPPSLPRQASCASPASAQTSPPSTSRASRSSATRRSPPSRRRAPGCASSGCTPTRSIPTSRSCTWPRTARSCGCSTARATTA